MGRARLGSKRQLPNGRWLVRVSVGYTSDGRQRVKSATVDTEREADLKISELVLAMGRDPNLGNEVTLSSYFDTRFLPDREGYLAKKTCMEYRKTFDRHIRPVFGESYMSEIGHVAIQAWVAPMTHSTAQHCVATLRAVLRAAWDDGLLADEPMRHRVRMPKAGKTGRLPVWSAADVAAAMPAMEGHPLEALWLLMVGGGLRREEAYALFWRDLAFSDVLRLDGTQSLICRVTVDDAVTVEDGRKPTKTGFSERVVSVAEPFSTRLSEIAADADAPVCAVSLSNINRSWGALWQPRAVSTDGNGRYFRGRMLGPDGEPLVPRIPLSRMRATHETLMQGAGVTDSVNAAYHGHTNLQTDYRHYLVPNDGSIDGAADAAAARVREAM